MEDELHYFNGIFPYAHDFPIVQLINANLNFCHPLHALPKRSIQIYTH